MGTDDSNKWLAFYQHFFPSPKDAFAFVSPVENFRPGDRRHPAKIMMHQTQRLVSLADDISSIRPGNETLQLLFLLVCAEHVAKLARDFNKFNKEGASRAYVRNFFRWFLSPQQKEQLSGGIMTHAYGPLPLEQAVDVLYDVRCDAVHEGKYWGFHFRPASDDPLIYCDPDVIVSLTLADFREIVVMGCINAIQHYPTPMN